MNKEIIEIFKELAEIYNILNDEFRSLAYSKAIASIRRYNKPLTDALRVKLPNIGSSIALKMNEIINTGQLKILKDLQKSPHIKLLRQMLRVQGFSKEYVMNLLKAFPNINTIEDIKKLHKAGKIKLNKTQEKGLKYSTDAQQKIPRSEIKKIGDIIKREAKKLFPSIHVELVGSYRRGKIASKDVDILIMKPKAKKMDNFIEDFVKHLKKAGIHEVTFNRGKRKFNGLVKTKNSRFARHLDIMYALPIEYPTALQSFTGSGVHNVRLRSTAKEKGYKLSDQGLFKNNKRVPIKTEHDIYKKLGMEYLPPSKRDV